uniref:F-box domain-containing protein n=1 Tax=Meloidogyne floridensis TaxID=298350 RepID=A0A915NWL5_9BILA
MVRYMQTSRRGTKRNSKEVAKSESKRSRKSKAVTDESSSQDWSLNTSNIHINQLPTHVLVCCRSLAFLFYPQQRQPGHNEIFGRVMCSGYSDSSLEPPTFINWAATRRGTAPIQSKIFSNLNTIDHLRIEKICRHWRQIAITYSWDNYEMISYSQVFQDCPAAKVTMCMKIQIIMKRARHHLKVIDLVGFRLDPKLNYSICSSLKIVPSVHTLYFDYMQLTNSSLSLIGLNGIQANCTNLETLIMDQVDTIQTQQMNNIFMALKNLTVLHFSECYGTEFYEGQPNLTALGNLTQLREMHVSDNLLINNDVLRAIGQGCRSLQLINLSMSNRAVTDTGLRHLASLSSLNELRLTGHRALTDETLIEIANQGKLKILGLGKCINISNMSVIMVIRNCKELKTLDVSYCPNVTQVIFKELDKQMLIRYGRSNPTTNSNSDVKKFNLLISRSGAHGCIPQKYSPWIKIVDHYESDASGSGGGPLGIGNLTPGML